jgi:hypothetical protein
MGASGLLKGENRRVSIIVFILYSAFFLLFFSPYITHHSFPGISDNIVHLSIFKNYKIHFLAWLNGQNVGNALYPTKGPQIFLEPYFGEALLYNIVSLPFASDRVGYYVLISILYALNAFGLYMLCLQLAGNKMAAFLGGFIFAASAYSLSNYELLNGLVFFPSFFTLYYFERYIKEDRAALFFYAAIWAGAQAYFSLYFFLFLFFIVLIIGMCRLVFKHWKWEAVKFKYFFVSLIIVLLVIAPVLLWLFYYAGMNGAYNPLANRPELVKNYSISIDDLLMGYPTNLLYGNFFQKPVSGTMKNVYYCNTGLLLAILFVISFFVKGKKQWAPYYIVFALGLLIALGPEIRVGSLSFSSPVKFIFDNERVSSFFRITGRAYNMSVLSLAIIGAFSFSFLLSKINTSMGKALVLVSALVIFSVENLPARLYTPDTRFIFSPDRQYISYLEVQRNALVLELPSSLFTNSVSDSLIISEFGREYVYTYWQTLHGKNIINGSSAYFPQSRISNNVLILNAKTPADIKALIDQNAITTVVFHKKFVMNDREVSLLAVLRESPFLYTELENNEVVIYKVK